MGITWTIMFYLNITQCKNVNELLIHIMEAVVFCLGVVLSVIILLLKSFGYIILFNGQLLLFNVWNACIKIFDMIWFFIGGHNLLVM